MSDLLEVCGFAREIDPEMSATGCLAFTGRVWRAGVWMSESDALDLARDELRANAKRGPVVVRRRVMAVIQIEQEHVSEPASSGSGG